MFKQFVGFLALCIGLNVVAQTTAPAGATPPARLRSAEELEKLVAPIALYPDSLVALILPAATESADLVMAARYLNAGRDPAGLDAEPWDQSVKALARYPDVVKWMDTNLEWTRDLGDAFLAQPTDVMNAVQRLRLSARSSGVLQDTPQQKVLVDVDEVRIVPTSTEYIYIPYYDPDILFTRRYYSGPVLSFSVGFAIGHWLHYDCDWRARSIWVHPAHHGWMYTPGWRPTPQVVVVGRPAPVIWAPRPSHVHYTRPPTVVRREVVYPRPMPHHPSPGPGIAPAPAPRPRLGDRAEPAHDDHRRSPGPAPRVGSRPTQTPTPAPSVPTTLPAGRPYEWRQRPSGQPPSHGYPTGPQSSGDYSHRRPDDGNRRMAPAAPTSGSNAPTGNKDSSSNRSSSGNSSSSSSTTDESKSPRGGEGGRAHLQRTPQ